MQIRMQLKKDAVYEFNGHRVRFDCHADDGIVRFVCMKSGDTFKIVDEESGRAAPVRVLDVEIAKASGNFRLVRDEIGPASDAPVSPGETAATN